MSSRMIRTAISAAVLATMVASPALAQEIGAQPTFSNLTLEAGFTPDPYRIQLTAGGDINVERTQGGECVGMIANAPDIRLTYSPDELPLNIRVSSKEDTTLVINGPDGSWYCDDDSGGGENPMISFTDPEEGVYEIWVGTYEDEPVPATVIITELDD